MNGQLQKKGEYRAPTSRDKLRVFKFFCLNILKNITKPGTILKEEPQNKYTKKFLMMLIGIEKLKKIHKFKIEDELNFFEKNEKQDNVKLNQLKSDSKY